MLRRVRAVVSGLGACAALGLFLVGVPVLLLQLVGNPLPAEVPAWSSVVEAVESATLPPGVASGVVAVTVWIWWSQVVVSLTVEIRAACGGRAAWRLPLRGLGMQPLVMRLIAVVVTAAGTIGVLAQPAVASTASFMDIAVPLSEGRTSDAKVNGSLLATPADDETDPLSAKAGLSLSATEVVTVPPPPVLELPIPPQVDLSVSGSAGEPQAQVAKPPVLGLPISQDRVEGTLPAAEQALARAETVTAETVIIDQPAVTESVNAADTEQALLVVEVVEPVSTDQLAVNAEVAEVIEAANEPEGASWIVVKPGDSLWQLAEEHLGDPLRWPEIFELNAGELAGGGTLRDPNLIHPGWRLRLR